MGIYPKINLPTLVTPTNTTPPAQIKIAPRFDFDAGEFVFDNAGRPTLSTPQETFEQWCLKACLTERNTRLAYDDRYGVELAGIEQQSAQVAKSRIIKTFSEAILVHPTAHWVKNFSFRADADRVSVSFDVKGKTFGESRLEVEL